MNKNKPITTPYATPKFTHRYQSISTLLLALLLFTPSTCFSAELTLNWTANMVADYKIYFGGESRFDTNANLKANFQYDLVIDLSKNLVCTPEDPTNCAGLPTTDLSCTNLNDVSPTCTIKNLTPDQLYFFAATASTPTVESALSMEVSAIPRPTTAIPSPEVSFTDLPNYEGIRGTASYDHNWNIVTHNKNMQNPVIITGPPNINDYDYGTSRLQNISADSFEITFQESKYSPQSTPNTHSLEESSFMALEQGTHQMSDGSIWEVGTFDLGISPGIVQWQNVFFSTNSTYTPYLFLTIQTNNDSSPATIRLKTPANNSFSVAMFEEEGITDGHAVEKIGYLAIFAQGTAGEISGLAGFSPYRLAKSSTSHLFSPTLGKQIMLQEDQSFDLETGHTFEDINSLEIDSTFFSQAISYYGGDPFALRQRPSFYSTTSVSNQWYRVPISTNPTNPVIIAGPPSLNDTDPGVIRISNITATSFDMKFQEWSYLNAVDGGTHQLEDVAWLALDPGLYPMPDGSFWEVGVFQLGGTGVFRDVNFAYDFGVTPTIFLTVQTYNGGDPVTVRATDVNSLRFRAALFEEDSKMTSGHATETIGYLAIHKPTEFGSGTIAGQQFSYNINSGSLNHNPTPVGNFALTLQEEQSLDLETFHALETINILTINNTIFSQDISSTDNDPASIRFEYADTSSTTSPVDTGTDGVDLASFILEITNNPTSTINLEDFSNCFGQ